MATKQSEQSTKAPSQAPVFDGLWTGTSTSTSEAQGIPLGKVLYDSGDSFKRFMGSHVKILTRKMRKSKIFPKKFMDSLRTNRYPIGLLMGQMNEMSQEKFVDYLQLLLSIAKDEEEDAEKKEKEAKTEDTKLMVFKEDTKKLIGIMKGSLEAMKAEPGSKLGTVISDIVFFVGQDYDIQSQTAIQANIIQPDLYPSPAPLTSSAPLPKGQLGDSVSGVFTNEGGILYSPLHGVTVIIPPNSIPPEPIPRAFPRFFLSMHFYLLDPFTLEDDVELCSVIVWFHQSPQFHFLKDVTIKIPHAAIVDDTNDDSLCVLTNKQFKLNTKISADFSDGYHAVFKVKHFCAKAAVKIKEKRQPTRRSTRNRTACSNVKKNLEKCHSSSLERSIEEGMATLTHRDSTEPGPSSRTLPNQNAMDTDSPASAASKDSIRKVSDMKYSIVCGMPRDRSQRNWNVLFAAGYSNPTWNGELEKLVKTEFGTDADFEKISDVRIKGNSFELCKEDWSDHNWKVFSRSRPPLISVNCIQQLPREPKPEEVPPSPRVTFKVSSLREGSHSDLECWIKAKGAVALNEEEISFLVDSTLPPVVHSKDERVIKIARYLYGDESEIIGALIASPAKDIILNTKFPDHRKFLGEISLQISNTDAKKLCAALDRPDWNDLDAFSILVAWVNYSRNVTVTRLKEQLRALNILDIAVHENRNKQKLLLNSNLEKISIMDFWDKCSEFRQNLSHKLQCCWMNVGKLLGITVNDLEIIRTKELEMIYEWQRREGEGATFGALFKAIQRVFELDSKLINDAHCFCENSLTQLTKLMSKNT